MPLCVLLWIIVLLSILTLISIVIFRSIEDSEFWSSAIIVLSILCLCATPNLLWYKSIREAMVTVHAQPILLEKP